jgi:hypothetical protein
MLLGTVEGCFALAVARLGKRGPRQSVFHAHRICHWRQNKYFLQKEAHALCPVIREAERFKQVRTDQNRKNMTSLRIHDGANGPQDLLYGAKRAKVVVAGGTMI